MSRECLSASGQRRTQPWPWQVGQSVSKNNITRVYPFPLQLKQELRSMGLWQILQTCELFDLDITSLLDRLYRQNLSIKIILTYRVRINF